ncbi:hypothetical protein [Candidatus Synchoanobacter obligatus]|uniref:BZIP domain-containing protein n=1 Tax=Candidatus Synchoanobacter obligatus TaxID=2919597 RepID=A0ABT1L3Y2_9GAMM|nr:hypothetical protein [Candidatus Synchoanobacter obligatus]MCP8351899.1 hypothetical protein [Candidatus Synchoanobacter obligatus]
MRTIPENNHSKHPSDEGEVTFGCVDVMLFKNTKAAIRARKSVITRKKVKANRVARHKDKAKETKQSLSVYSVNRLKVRRMNRQERLMKIQQSNLLLTMMPYVEPMTQTVILPIESPSDPTIANPWDYFHGHLAL